MRYYGVYLSGRSRDRLVNRRVNRSAAERLARQLQASHPSRLYYVVRIAPLTRKTRLEEPL